MERVATKNQLAAHPVFGEFSFPVLDNVPVINRYYERYLELSWGRIEKAAINDAVSPSCYTQHPSQLLGLVPTTNTWTNQILFG